MVAIPPFEVELWMDAYETDAEYNIAETCCDSISLEQVLKYAGEDPKAIASSDLFTARQTYGHIKGSPKLRQCIADLFNTSFINSDKVVVTQGAIAANFLLLFSLCKPGDHIIAVDPTYQQLHELPVSFGADLSRWHLKESQGWVPDIKTFEALLTPRTSLVILNSPNNPTGQLTPTHVLEEIIRLVKEKAAPGCVIHCDEVYRPIFHDTTVDRPKSIVELGYKHTVSTGSMSKAYSLAGLRVGWMVSPDPQIIEAATLRRDYNIISISTLDDHFASIALSSPARDEIVKRNISLANTNRQIVEDWISKQDGVFRWVTPNCGTTGLIALPDGVDDEDFCRELHKAKKVVLVPAGKCFNLPGYVRIGYVSDTETLREGLSITSEFMKEYMDRRG